MALLVSGGAFAQNLEKIMPSSGEAEAIMADNLKNGREFHDGLLKVYNITVDVSVYDAEDTHYINKTSSLISDELGYSTFSCSKVDDINGKKAAVFTFSGTNYTNLEDVKKYISSLGFTVLIARGELQIIE